MSGGSVSGSRPWWLRALLRCPADLGSLAARIVVTVMVAGGAACTVGSGIIHLYLWGKQYGYQDIPTIGPLFLAQGIAAILIGLLAIVSRRVVALLAAAGLMTASVVAIVLAMESGLFGFRDSWIVPYAWTTLYEEIAGAVLLIAAAVMLAWPSPGAAARSGSGR